MGLLHKYFDSNSIRALAVEHTSIFPLWLFSNEGISDAFFSAKVLQVISLLFQIKRTAAWNSMMPSRVHILIMLMLQCTKNHEISC